MTHKNSGSTIILVLIIKHKARNILQNMLNISRSRVKNASNEKYLV